MWVVKATYTDGSEVCEYFNEIPGMGADEQQHYLETWLLTRKSDCTWYSVDWVDWVDWVDRG